MQAVALYGVGESTVNRWVRAGADAGSEPPLLDPVAMTEWYERLRLTGIFKQRIPQSIIDACNLEKPRFLGSSIDGESDSIPAEGLSLKDHLAELAGKPFSYLEAVRGAETMLRACQWMLDKAIESGDATAIGVLQTRFNKSQDAYRNAKKQEKSIMDASGMTLNKDAVRRELHALNSNIVKRIRQAFKAAFSQKEKHMASVEAWRDYVDSQTDTICAEMQAAKFAE